MYSSFMYSRDIDKYSNHILKLVRPKKEYAKTTITWLINPKVTKYLGEDFSKTTYENEVEHLNGISTDKDCFSWMIELDGRIVGNVEINQIKKTTKKYGAKSGSFCTLIGSEKDWGKGIGTISKKYACNWAFRDGGFKFIEAKAYVQNDRSWVALEHSGFQYKNNENEIVNGQSVEWKVYLLSKHDWELLEWSKD